MLIYQKIPFKYSTERLKRALIFLVQCCPSALFWCEGLLFYLHFREVIVGVI